MVSEKVGRAEKCDLLIEEYKFLKSEMGIYISLYHKHSNVAPILFAATTPVLLLILSSMSRSDSPITQKFLEIYTVWGLIYFSLLNGLVFFFASVFLLVSAFYFTASIGYIYLIELLAKRALEIEIRINELVEEDLMRWECKIAPDLIRDAYRVLGGMSPNHLRSLWSYIVAAFVLIISFISLPPFVGHDLYLIYCVISIFVVSAIFRQHYLYYTKIIPKIGRKTISFALKS